MHSVMSPNPTTTSSSDDKQSSSSSSSSPVVIATSNEAFPHPPWQFGWKSPQWHALVPQKEDTTAATSSTNTTTATPLDHAAARIQIPGDVPLEAVHPEEKGTVGNNDNNDEYVLTATLATGHFGQGTDIQLQVWKQPQPKITTSTNNLHAPPAHVSVVASRSLQWPATSMMMSTTETQQQPQPQQDDTSSTSTSLVAIGLARRPPPDALAEWTDALDVLHWLSLDRTTGLTPVQREWLNHLQQPPPPPPPPEEEEEEAKEASKDEEKEDVSFGELLLLCLDTHRVLHVYKMYDIWQTPESDPHDGGMAAWMLGIDLLAQVQSRILPLTQPWQQLRLSAREDPLFRTRDGPSAAVFGAQQQHPQHLVAVADVLCIAGGSSKKKTKQGSGFCTFVSLRTLEEVRTVYLPFNPQHLYPWTWQGWIFLLCVGPHQEICAIRVDAATETTVPTGEAPSLFQTPLATVESPSSRPLLNIGRFQLVPVVWPRFKDSDGDSVQLKMVVGSAGIHCAAVYQRQEEIQVVQYAFGAVNSLPDDRPDMTAVYGKYRPPGLTAAGLPVFLLRAETVVATLSTTLPQTKSIWCYTRQGWGLLGLGRQVYWVGWQGQRQTVAFCKHVATLPEDDFSPLVETIQPLDPLRNGDVLEQSSVHATTTSSASATGVADDSAETSSDVDTLIVEAMDSISALNYRGTNSPPASPLRKLRKALTQQEKSKRLLRRCSNWTRLERFKDSTQQLNNVQAVVSIRGKTSQYVLTIRQADLQYAEAVPFDLVLSWLAHHEDYFTAASLALDLLQDGPSLRHLWESYGKIRLDQDGGYAVLEGLLDGVSPVIVDDKKRKGVSSPVKRTLIQLADMTIGCLTKGGHRMSSTLEHFVLRDVHFNASRAALMFVATADCTLSDDPESVAVAMGKGYTKTSHEDIDHEAILWPIRALLNVGVARDILGVVLLLLNATIPDTLRNRKASDLASATEPSLSLCKSLVSLIVGTTPDAAELLLGLIDEQSRVLYWNSLTHETQLELSLVRIREDSSPMLMQPAVRNWVLSQLQECLATEGSAQTVNVFEITPHGWVQELVVASLLNAQCSLKEVQPAGTLSREDNVTPGFDSHCARVEKARDVILSSKGQFCIDFDLLIGSLLVLERRELEWWEGARVSTQSLLNAACHFAGRRSKKETVAPLNAPALMRQCFLAGNVQAGANLIGGLNGLVLECCHVLVATVGLEMDEAEKFLLADSIPQLKQPATTSKFAPLEPHYEVLCLLREHVLKIRQYGDFAASSSRGRVDPISAARICLRTWWRITHDTKEATPWLVRWLQEQLEIVDNRSRHRLACAALLRALIWPSETSESVQSDPSTLLASYLSLPNYFITQLSLSACGLVEAVPKKFLELMANPSLAVAKAQTDTRTQSNMSQMSDNISRLSSSSLSVDS